MKAIIIGSGIAGVTAGAALTKEGFDVTVFEQYHRNFIQTNCQESAS